MSGYIKRRVQTVSLVILLGMKQQRTLHSIRTLTPTRTKRNGSYNLTNYRLHPLTIKQASNPAFMAQKFFCQWRLFLSLLPPCILFILRRLQGSGEKRALDSISKLALHDGVGVSTSNHGPQSSLVHHTTTVQSSTYTTKYPILRLSPS